MQITVVATTEGDILRSAAAELRAPFPAAAEHLVLMARRADLRIARERWLLERREDTRGRWVRRAQSTGGPGVPGLGHISVLYRCTSLRSSETLCGKALIGGLEWEVGASATALPPDGWRCCRACFTALRTLSSELRLLRADDALRAEAAVGRTAANGDSTGRDRRPPPAVGTSIYEGIRR